ncbi:MAG TPA: amino acid permease, partial [Xanthobacteraceae bacterium]|nr:amino acid permease [Xanthobacteraceae bacterium]
MANFWARKPITMLQAEADEADVQALTSHGRVPLRRTLSALNLVALGIGAIIGAGIFVLTGHAAAANAGPAIVLSFILGGIACAFAGLCYAEMASTVPVAGSAYTYAYATMGELIAWIIGWDLILEYAFSNMSVSVGFAAHIEALVEWFGIHPPLQWISPAYLPTGLQDFAGNTLYQPGWHFGFNIPAFLIV